MAPRPFWKGYLKLSLVTCPVAMMPATTEGEKVRFHTLDRATGHRVASRYIDAVTGNPVDENEEVKGYERGDNDFVVLEDDELEAVALESTRTIDISTFVGKDTIDWVWFDRPHYLFPDDPVGEQAFSVIRDAMAATKTVAVSRLVLYRRERAVMLEPRDKGIVLWTLRYGEEVRDPEPYFAGVDSGPPAPKMLRSRHNPHRQGHEALESRDGFGPRAGSPAGHHRGKEGEPAGAEGQSQTGAWRGGHQYHGGAAEEPRLGGAARKR